MNLRRLSTSSPISVEKISSLLHGVFQAHLQERALLRIHRGVRQLFGVHFAQTLVALHAGVLLAFVLDVLEQFHPVGLRIAMLVLHHHERRLVELRDGARQGAEAAVLRLRGQLQCRRCAPRRWNRGIPRPRRSALRPCAFPDSGPSACSASKTGFRLSSTWKSALLSI